MIGTTLYNTQKEIHPAQGCTTNSSTAGSLPLEPSCSRGKTLSATEAHLRQELRNLEYKGTQQDLTNEKERLQGYAGLWGIKVIL